MASIKQLTDRKFKITISNGYRPNGKKICKAKTITVPDSVKPRGIPQYVAHEAEELERLVKSGFAEDRDTTFEAYATRWLERQVKYAPGTLASYCKNRHPSPICTRFEHHFHALKPHLHRRSFSDTVGAGRSRPYFVGSI